MTSWLRIVASVLNWGAFLWCNQPFHDAFMAQISLAAGLSAISNCLLLGRSCSSQTIAIEMNGNAYGWLSSRPLSHILWYSADVCYCPSYFFQLSNSFSYSPTLSDFSYSLLGFERFSWYILPQIEKKNRIESEMCSSSRLVQTVCQCKSEE